ncbi:MAG TPA: hypothetical protein PLM93_11265 [Sulfuricurvum sp.]|nr:MAG: hypothetical protein B7Y30_10765 [Campylobacterales bacterium 16-40-21]OZA02089.1 MAG: hypothetical protein B7X89_10775 [Sulfuricurvum sp. 17-40-25]HQS67752.1 hypothetical protein [Sulfuricurvum sp.]HQT37461.1 hypothetical protein [Sulfuricurvum sp.]
MRQPFMAYENDTDTFTIDNLHIQNGTDTIIIEGSLAITKDSEGLKAALKLKRAVDSAIDALKRNRNLPDSIRQ